MTFKYTYKDWQEGSIIWNSIESNKYEKNYISEDCIAKIRKHQQVILRNESNKITENLIRSYISNRRKSRDRNTLLSGLLRTIDNLLNKDVDSFKDTTVLDEKQAMMETIPKELKVKVIPPLNWTTFERNQIFWIQEAYSHFYTLNEWNIEVVETPIEEQLSTFVEYNGTIRAQAFIEFARRLRQYEGVIFNTFKSEVNDFNLGQLRVDLINRGFIAKTTNRELFIKMFQGYYLFKNERLNWLKNLDSLRYFITQLDSKLTYSREYPKWVVVCNCFMKDDKDINSESLRKATKIDNYSKEKVRLENIVSPLI